MRLFLRGNDELRKKLANLAEVYIQDQNFLNAEYRALNRNHRYANVIRKHRTDNKRNILVDLMFRDLKTLEKLK